MRYLCLFFFLFSGIVLNAQEICDNSIDDDGDGWIDIQDNECDCIPTDTATISADFEAYNECPSTFTYSSDGVEEGYFLIDTDIEWDIASLATTDYLNTCDYLGGDGQVPFIPLPIPSGDGAIGMISNSSGNYVEGISECLDCRMVPGETYQVQFYVGFNDDVGPLPIQEVSSSSPVEFALLGRTNCINIPYIGSNALLPETGWEEVATFTAEGQINEWVLVEGSFVAQEDYIGLAFYKSLAFTGSSPIKEYHFMDDLRITGLFKGKGCGIPQPLSVNVIIESTGDCLSSFNLIAEAESAVSYQWYLDGAAIIGETDSTLNNLTQEGNYQVRVFSPDGICTVSEPIDLQSATINITNINTTSSCFEDSTGEINLEVSGLNPPYNFEWSNGGSSSSISNLAAGDYEVTITDSLGCERIEQIPIISFDEIIVLENIFEPDCADEQGSILLFSNVPSTEIIFEWDNGTDQFFLDALPGTYGYTVTDGNGCFVEGSETITGPDSLFVQIIVQQNPSIGQTDGFITVQANGGTTPYNSYQWSTGNSGPSISNLGPGVYQVTVTDANDCTATLEITLDQIEALSVDFSLENNICLEDCDGQISLIISGGVMPYTVLWSDGQVGAEITNLCDGIYSATVSDNIGQLFTVPEVEINSLFNLEIESTISPVSCISVTDGEISVMSSGGIEPYSYEWNEGNSTTATLTNLSSGNYFLTIQDFNGCQLVDSFFVEDYFPIEMDYIVEPIDCNYETYSLNIASISPLINEVSYLLNGTLVSETYEITVMDQDFQNYELAYQDANNCVVPFGEFSLSGGVPYQVLIDESRQELIFGEAVNLEFSIFPQSQLFSAFNLEWTTINPFDCITSIGENCLEISLTAQENEIIEVVFTDSIGCEQSFLIPINVRLPESYIYIPNVFSPNDDGFNDQFSIFTTDFVLSVSDFKVYNRWGGLMFEQIGDGIPSWNGEINGKQAQAGVYVYNMIVQLANGEQRQINGDITLIR